VQPQPIRSQAAATPRPAPQPDTGDANEPLVELTSLGRGDPDEIVKEPPEVSAPVAQIIRRLSDSVAASDA
jgi:hypothetical protein